MQLPVDPPLRYFAALFSLAAYKLTGAIDMPVKAKKLVMEIDRKVAFSKIVTQVVLTHLPIGDVQFFFVRYEIDLQVGEFSSTVQ